MVPHTFPFLVVITAKVNILLPSMIQMNCSCGCRQSVIMQWWHIQIWICFPKVTYTLKQTKIITLGHAEIKVLVSLNPMPMAGFAQHSGDGVHCLCELLHVISLVLFKKIFVILLRKVATFQQFCVHPSAYMFFYCVVSLPWHLSISLLYLV